VLLCAWPAGAQEQRGSIEGFVKDSSGAVVPGVAVEARSDTLAARLASATTDVGGHYRFPALPPGRYEVTANMVGFGPARVENVDLALGKLLKVDLTLKAGAVTETVTVVGEAPLIDVRQSARATSLRDEAISKMPKGRDFLTVVTQAPGVNRETKSAGISIDGSSGGENRYIIDGAEVTNIQSGQAGRDKFGTVQSTVLITDFIDEVQVKSSGYSAEYGGSTGGVINVITKNGSNHWRGDALFYYSGDSLDGPPRKTLRRVPTDITRAEYITYGKDSYNRWEPGFALGGPLVRDKAWFFAGYNPAFRPYDRTTALSNRSVVTQRQDFKAHYGTANVAAQLTNNVRLKTAFNMYTNRTNGVLPDQALLNEAGTTSPLANLSINTVRPQYSVGASLDYTPSSRVYVSLRGGWYHSDVYNENVPDVVRYSYSSSNVGMAGVPVEFQHPTSFANVPTNTSTTHDLQTRANVQFDTTYFFSGAGEHQLKLGAQFDRIGNNVFSGELENRVTIRWNQSLSGQRGTYGYYSVRAGGTAFPSRGFTTVGDIHSNNLGLFIQDAWTIKNRLTLNLGLRTENEHIPSFADPSYGLPDVAIKFGFGDKLAPRAGFAYDVKGDGKWKAYGSWGIFYDITKLEMPRGSFGGDKWLEYYYTLDIPNPEQLRPAGCPPACPGRLLNVIDFRHPSNDPSENTIDPNLKPMKLQEYVAGVEHELTGVLSVGLRYAHKQLDRAIEDVGSLDAQQNEIYKIANPGFSTAAFFFPAGSTQQMVYPKARRDYDSIEVALNRRMANRWAGRVSYIWSRLFGNYAGLAESDEDGRASPNVGRNFDYPLMSFDQNGRPVEGVLATDRTHQVKAQLVYDAPFNLSLGMNWYGASGIPLTRQASFIPPNNYPIFYLGRSSDGHLPFYAQLDLYAQYEMKLNKRVRLILSANALNVFDQKTATNYAADQIQGSGIKVSEPQFYSGVNTQALIAAQGLILDPRFLMSSGFEDPRTVRLGVRLSF